MKNKNNQCLGNFYVFCGGVIYLGSLAKQKFHSFHSIIILIGNKKPANLITKNGTYQGYALLMGPDVPHIGKDNEKEAIFIMLIPESVLGQKLAKKNLKNKDVIPLKIKRDISLYDNYFSDPSIKNVVKIYHSIINSLEITDNMAIQKDDRIVKAVNFIRNLEVKKASTKEIAEHVGLSEGRLIHLFKEQIGIPIRRYLLWHRLIDATNAIRAGKSPTCAAHEAEFADYAHLSRCFTSTFGFPLSFAFKHFKIIDINPYI